MTDDATSRERVLVARAHGGDEQRGDGRTSLRPMPHARAAGAAQLSSSADDDLLSWWGRSAAAGWCPAARCGGGWFSIPCSAGCTWWHAGRSRWSWSGCSALCHAHGRPM